MVLARVVTGTRWPGSLRCHVYRIRRQGYRLSVTARSCGEDRNDREESKSLGSAFQTVRCPWLAHRLRCSDYHGKVIQAHQEFYRARLGHPPTTRKPPGQNYVDRGTESMAWAAITIIAMGLARSHRNYAPYCFRCYCVLHPEAPVKTRYRTKVPVIGSRPGTGRKS